MRRIEIAVAAAAFALATPALAQGRGHGKGKASQRTTTTGIPRSDDVIYGRNGDVIYGGNGSTGSDRVPPGHLPPPGMCRVWIDGVPPGHQPPVTDCGTAQMQRTANSRIIYGDQTPFPGKGRNRTSSNQRVVSINGRQCVERQDVYGNVRYECQDDRYGRRDGTYDPRGVYGSRSGVYSRDDEDDDSDRYENEARGAGNAGKFKSKANKANKARGRNK
jgi:hypothetical protein